MKRLLICALVMFAFTVTAYAEMTGHEGHEMKHEMMKEEGHQMMCPKMQEKGMMHKGDHQMSMMGHGMMMQDLMQTMTEILNIQEKIITGVKASEKKQLLNKIKGMKAKMGNSMSMCKCMAGDMMGGGKCPMMQEGMGEQSAPAKTGKSGAEEKEKDSAPKAGAHQH